jgi:hypothetical protein
MKGCMCNVRHLHRQRPLHRQRLLLAVEHACPCSKHKPTNPLRNHRAFTLPSLQMSQVTIEAPHLCVQGVEHEGHAHKVVRGPRREVVSEPADVRVDLGGAARRQVVAAPEGERVTQKEGLA